MINFKSISLAIIVILSSIFAGILLYRLTIPIPSKPVAIYTAWKEDFDGPTYKKAKSTIPDDWKLQPKLGTPPAIFSVVKDGKDGINYLRMEADEASGSIITKIPNIDIKRTPILKWQWRALVLPKDADGRVKGKDDQAIGIYVGTGGMTSQKTISYRWDTDTPKGDEGSASYGGGVLKVKWITLRNKGDVQNSKWFIEERNIAEDFKKMWGFCPEKIFLGVSCNSQYTGTKALAELAWIEFTSKQIPQ